MFLNKSILTAALFLTFVSFSASAMVDLTNTEAIDAKNSASFQSLKNSNVNDCYSKLLGREMNSSQKLLQLNSQNHQLIKGLLTITDEVTADVLRSRAAHFLGFLRQTGSTNFSQLGTAFHETLHGHFKQYPKCDWNTIFVPTKKGLLHVDLSPVALVPSAISIRHLPEFFGQGIELDKFRLYVFTPDQSTKRSVALIVEELAAYSISASFESQLLTAIATGSLALSRAPPRFFVEQLKLRHKGNQKQGEPELPFELPGNWNDPNYGNISGASELWIIVLSALKELKISYKGEFKALVSQVEFRELLDFCFETIDTSIKSSSQASTKDLVLLNQKTKMYFESGLAERDFRKLMLDAN